MAGTFVTQASVLMFESFLDAMDDIGLHLYTAATITPDMTEADVTEATGGGYSAITLNRASWSPVGDPVETEYPEQTFSFSGSAGTILGYYLTDAGTGTLLGIEALDAPFATGAGYALKITPKLKLAS
jgi:hypothetical protein